MTTFDSTKSPAVTFALVALFAPLASGCELILNFNRGLIDGGGVDVAFNDAALSDAGLDGSADALIVPEAASDALLGDALPDSPRDGRSDAPDATLDGHTDGPSRMDAMPDGSKG